VYPVGVDPVWYLAKNELSYMNSLKMKVAVILGVAQMTLGVVLKGLNYRYQGKRLEFWFEAVPQLILLLSLFGFMDILIVIKWLTDYSQPSAISPDQNTLSAPSIISTMIVMVLGLGEQSDPRLKERDLIPYQTGIMRFLLILVLVSAPVMLLVKPLYERSKM
jgi:V-type H+-transporting ATPase subunit a